MNQNRSVMAICLATLTIFFMFASAAFAAQITVPVDYATIQAAIDASTTGDTIVVNPGTYDERINFLGKGITVKSTDPLDPAIVSTTIISGQNVFGTLVTFESGETSSSVLDGLTITRGRGNSGNGKRGGGAFIDTSSPVIQNCVFDLNYAGNDAAGAIYILGSGSALIKDCDFTNNRANTFNGHGGAMLILNNDNTIIDGCVFQDNQAKYGGAISIGSGGSPQITNSTFLGNIATTGGAIHIFYCSPQISDTVIDGNTAYDYAGGVSFTTGASATFERCKITNNHSDLDGGGVMMLSGPYTPIFINTIIAGNTAVREGAGVNVSVSTSVSPEFTNCTIANNIAGQLGGGVITTHNSTLTNSIVWGNSPDQIALRTSEPTLSYSVVQGGFTGTAVIDADPLFSGDIDNPYNHNPGSPAIDSGTATGAPSTDILGTIRPEDGDANGSSDYDIGAYEYIRVCATDGDVDSWLDCDGDCNDSDPDINPGATETPYNGIDENCNGLADDTDFDSDGYEYTEECDDSDAAINPAATEIPYNSIDENCNGMTDDDDVDGDGYLEANDCDDDDAAINPAATEIYYNGIDENCNGLTDDDDVDGDGYLDANDCNDDDAAINPGVAEIPYNSIDENCNGMDDDDDVDGDGYLEAVDCNDDIAAINPGATETYYNGIDENCNGMDDDDDVDGDGYLDAVDCRDDIAAINPGAAEIYNNGIDENCNGLADDVDFDNDNFDETVDCDDQVPTTYPGAPETKSDGVDQDCNGYDLTIDITEARYVSKNDELQVKANSALDATANLNLDGYQAMTWTGNRWELTITGVGGNPGTITVSGIEGSESLTVTAK